MWTSITLLLGLVCTPLIAAEPGLLIGNWVMPESEAVPMSCSGVHVEYRLNGITVSTSGQNITAATYKATPHNRGYLLEQIETWNNQQPNSKSSTVNMCEPTRQRLSMSRLPVQNFASFKWRTWKYLYSL